MDIEIRDSSYIHKKLVHKTLKIDFAPENAFAFYEVDHASDSLDLERDALYVEGSVFYHSFTTDKEKKLEIKEA